MILGAKEITVVIRNTFVWENATNPSEQESQENTDEYSSDARQMVAIATVEPKELKSSPYPGRRGKRENLLFDTSLTKGVIDVLIKHAKEQCGGFSRESTVELVPKGTQSEDCIFKEGIEDHARYS
ncbi:hypothetical protein O9G_000774 [Rozella allomycis CSF55]|uniref:Uncharacterized protein n=1 Tax=Rozella allomycis (strain CSF55) TaxID=988480 RepID=A0A075AW03_ROZAC|nr:hypothetical protein O9G_000774 [Rozella allomycis CSF55]|eukprot:EPZ32699.1 hypothetical protein O9G_000774 [Rozella allomycis CSF55]